MAKLNELVSFLNSAMMLDQVNGDPSNNGLQVEGKENIKKVICSVDASETIIYKAMEMGADFIFVHHGISWGGSLKYITDYNARLIKPLLKNDVSLYAAHLPLDGHPEFGHNLLLADIVRLHDKMPFAEFGGIPIGVCGKLSRAVSAEKLALNLCAELKSIIKSYAVNNEDCELKDECRVLGAGRMVSKIGIVSGGGGVDALRSAIDKKLDCLITGELSHSMYYLAKENNVSVIAAGHYNTEVPGILAVMDLLKNNFDIDAEFVNFPTGI